MVSFFDFPATLTPHERQVKLLLGVDLDLDSISADSKNQVFSIGKIWLLAGD